MLTEWLMARRAPALVAGLCALGFIASLTCDFVYDDRLLIVENPYAHSFQHAGRAFSTHFWDTAGPENPHTLRYYRPLVTLSFITDWWLGGGSPWWFHLTNTLLHAANTWLAARFAKRVLAGSPLWLLPTLLFAVHPTRIESVVWVSGRTDLWMTLWLLLALEAAARWQQGGRSVALAALGLFGLAALLSKELAVVLPVLLLIERSARPKPKPKRARGSTPFAWRQHAALLLTGGLSVGYLTARALFFPMGVGALQWTPLSFLAAVEGYAERLLWPWPQGFFVRPLVMGSDGLVHPTWQLLGGGMLCLLCGALLVHSFKRRRAGFWCFLSAAVLLAPALHLMPTGLPVLVADRFWYLPLLLLGLGLSLTLQTSLNAFLARPKSGMLVGLLSLCMLGVMLVTLPRFSSESALWSAQLEDDACNPRAHEHFAKQSASQGQLRQAQEHLARILHGDCIAKSLAQHEVARAAYARALELEAALTADADQRKLDGLYQRATTLLMGKPRASPGGSGLPTPASQFFESSVRFGAYRNVSLLANLASLAERLGRDVRARGFAEEAASSDLAQLTAPGNLVLTLARLGDFARARWVLDRLSTAKPPLMAPLQVRELYGRLATAERLLQNASGEPPLEAHQVRAQALANLGAYARALRELTPAYQQQPRPPTAVLYAQLLVAARSEGEARKVILHSESKQRADGIIASIRAGLPPQLAGIPSVD